MNEKQYTTENIFRLLSDYGESIKSIKENQDKIVESLKCIKDDYHSMEELYDHRTVLFALVCACLPDISWKSKKHSDGTSEDGWFIAGLETNYGQISYHQKELYWNLFNCKELEKAPEYDGHTPAKVLTILSLLIRDIKI